MGLMGALGAHIADNAKMESWTGAKERLTPEGFQRLHKQLLKKGETELKNGQRKLAYAVQAFVMSLTARASQDPEVKTGEKSLDALLDRVVAMHREAAKSQAS
jgi:hypothetical protein